MKSTRLIMALLLSLQSVAQVPQGDMATFLSLLKEYKLYPEIDAQFSQGKTRFDEFNPSMLERIPARALEARYRTFNSDYKRHLKIKSGLATQLKILSERLKTVALSEYAQRAELELKHRSLTDTYNQVKRLLFLSSVNANASVREALAMLPNDTLTQVTGGTPPNPASPQSSVSNPVKMPGVFGGEKEERLRLSESDKINLTPVDDAFYATQLGKKLESDLKGRADSWSYDYETDDLYVKVGNDIGKVRVVDQSPGVRFIQTRVGSGYREPAGSDTKVDMLTAEGRFLTNDNRAENLFGAYPSSTPKLSPELPPGHSKDDGHNHNH